jgi:phosphoribulokinase
MRAAIADAAKQGNSYFTHLHPEANLLSELENLFREYGETGTGRRRHGATSFGGDSIWN